MQGRCRGRGCTPADKRLCRATTDTDVQACRLASSLSPRGCGWCRRARTPAGPCPSWLPALWRLAVMAAVTMLWGGRGRDQPRPYGQRTFLCSSPSRQQPEARPGATAFRACIINRSASSTPSVLKHHWPCEQQLCVNTQNWCQAQTGLLCQRVHETGARLKQALLPLPIIHLDLPQHFILLSL